jgi:hypothetical protein
MTECKEEKCTTCEHDDCVNKHLSKVTDELKAMNSPILGLIMHIAKDLNDGEMLDEFIEVVSTTEENLTEREKELIKKSAQTITATNLHIVLSHASMWSRQMEERLKENKKTQSKILTFPNGFGLNNDTIN